MISFRVGRNGLAAQFVLGLLVPLVPFVLAEDAPEAKERLKLMQTAIGNLELESSELKMKPALTFASKPLLRYNDPTRGAAPGVGNVLVDATVWRLGTEGRPTALTTTEIYRVPNRPHLLSYEFLTLTVAKFSLKQKTENISWAPQESGLALKELPKAPKPAATAASRLVQMRQLARRFKAKERFRGESIECRLMTQPIDRYHSEEQKIVDGAIFVYVNSTNPELGVVLETDGKQWMYGTLRLSAAESRLTLDDREVAAYEFLNGTASGSYSNATHWVNMDKDK